MSSMSPEPITRPEELILSKEKIMFNTEIVFMNLKQLKLLPSFDICYNRFVIKKMLQQISDAPLYYKNYSYSEDWNYNFIEYFTTSSIWGETEIFYNLNINNIHALLINHDISYQKVSIDQILDLTVYSSTPTEQPYSRPLRPCLCLRYFNNENGVVKPLLLIDGNHRLQAYVAGKYDIFDTMVIRNEDLTPECFISNYDYVMFNLLCCFQELTFLNSHFPTYRRILFNLELRKRISHIKQHLKAINSGSNTFSRNKTINYPS